MKIFTSNGSEAKVDEMRQRDMGCLICSLPTSPIVKGMKKIECALDNGAYSCWLRGFPFMADVFLSQLTKAYRGGVKLTFIVCPDIVAGGMRSLRFSEEWAESEHLGSASNLYLAVQDGMTPNKLKDSIGRFSGLFVGGTKEWKYDTGREWVEYAHNNGMNCHIGRVGTLEKLKWAHEIGADSVDSSSFVRNDSWHIVDSFYRWRDGCNSQTDMFDEKAEMSAEY